MGRIIIEDYREFRFALATIEAVRILVIENNLLWSSKLKSGLIALGHAPVISPALPSDAGGYELAIVNLSQPTPSPKELIASLHSYGIKVIAHAGHKEKDLLQLGKEAGADVLVTNGELSAKLEAVVAKACRGENGES